jgi:hypothetical protein
MKVKEFIKGDSETQPSSWWWCLCGNEAHYDGFATCKDEGYLVEPVLDGEWVDKFICLRCYRIINNNTLEVTGVAGEEVVYDIHKFFRDEPCRSKQ